MMTAQRSEPESTYAWLRLMAALALMTIGGAGMYGIAVALAPVQAEFGATRGDASLPYTLTMLGFGLGGILMGRIADRFGVAVPARMKPPPRPKAPITTGTTTPKRSAMRPIRMPPRPKPSIVTV